MGFNIGGFLKGAVGGLLTGGPVGALTGGLGGGFLMGQGRPGIPGAGVGYGPRPTLTSSNGGISLPASWPGGGPSQSLRNFCMTAARPLNPADAAKCRSHGLPEGKGCESPMVMDQSGICVFPGSPGDLSTDPYGSAVVGAFGRPALQPAIVGVINARPIRRCPRGTVLGLDDLCYDRAFLTPRNKNRKWKAPRKGLISPKDVAALRRANRLRTSKENKKLFRELGLGGR